ncbi:MAG TPA: signal peptidase I [Chthonomonadaceae bacterium]|nr:signal peptidase I [Chthonomonadaceae bacterium]
MRNASRRQTILIALFLVIVFFFMTMFRMGVVRGASMEPTYFNGQVVLVRRMNWFSGRLHRGDVVLLRKDRDVIIKRIYRLPGEEIDASGPNGPNVALATFRHDLADYYEQQVIDTPRGPQTRLTVPEGFVVVIGDNLKVSEDSRVFGPLPLRDVLGVVPGAPPAPYDNSGPTPGSSQSTALAP